jgi:hypothetical protein
VLAFRRAASPSDTVKVTLKGLPADAKVEFENLDTAKKSVASGELGISLSEKRSSTVVLYRVK